MQLHPLQRPALDSRGHVGAMRLPAAIGGRARIEQTQTARGGRVPRDMGVPEHEHVGVGVCRRHPTLPPGRRSGLVNHREPHSVEGRPRDLRKPFPQRRAVVVAPARDQPSSPFLESLEQCHLDPVTRMDDDVGAIHLLPHDRRQRACPRGDVGVGQQQQPHPFSVALPPVGYTTTMTATTHDRLAVVTGADSGIGRATAELLASEGYDVGITFHTDGEGAEHTRVAVEQRGQRCRVAHQDLARPDTADTIDHLAQQLGGLGVLVNNAGTGHRDRALDLTYDQWREVLATDLDGPFLCAQRAARLMIDAGRGGRIVNVTSVHEHVPRLGASAYCSAKAGLGMLTQCLALELARYGITVNAVAPGEIATPMTGMNEPDAFHETRPGNPIGRPGHVDEIASVIAFLASPRASYLTGRSIPVDGGLMLMAAHGHDMADESWRTF